MPKQNAISFRWFCWGCFSMAHMFKIFHPEPCTLQFDSSALLRKKCEKIIKNNFMRSFLIRYEPILKLHLQTIIAFFPPQQSNSRSHKEYPTYSVWEIGPEGYMDRWQQPLRKQIMPSVLTQTSSWLDCEQREGDSWHDQVGLLHLLHPFLPAKSVKRDSMCMCLGRAFKSTFDILQ